MGQLDLNAIFSANHPAAKTANSAKQGDYTAGISGISGISNRVQPKTERNRLPRFARLVQSSAAAEGLFIETGAALAMLRPDDRQAVQDGTADPARLRTLAANIARRAARERGLVPVGSDAVVLCDQCGPVWLGPDEGPAVDECEWCDLYSAGQWFPRPPVRCGECRHFTPDTINLAGGMGDCDASGRRPGLCFPHSRQPCAAWRPESAGADINVRTGHRILSREAAPAGAI